MGLFDGKVKRENQELKAKIEEMESLLSPEMKDALSAQERIKQINLQVQECENTLKVKQEEVGKLTDKIVVLEKQIDEKKKNLIEMDDEVLVQEFGLYKTHFAFETSDEYKNRLQEIRDQEKWMIKNSSAVNGNMNWTVDGSRAKGRKMVSDTQKLLMRAFNSECDEVISKVRYTNYDSSLKRINKSAEAISKLGGMMAISISGSYLYLKTEELRIAFEYQQKKEQEKEAAREARAEMREAAKLQKEIEEQRKKLDKEQTHYTTAYEKVCEQLDRDPNNQDLIQKKKEIENQLKDIEKAFKDVDYREANQKAGYVYVISNIGAFGENVYKIGMTRRLDPQDRVDELGDASVPFNFDVHAMIFSDDAPALEAALHRAFEKRKLNMVNLRREFFKVSLDEIKEVVKKNYDKTVEFIDVPDAEQYRVSLKLREEMNH